MYGNLSILVLFSSYRPAITEIYTLSLHDALPIYWANASRMRNCSAAPGTTIMAPATSTITARAATTRTCGRSEEHTSELQSRQYLVCRLLLEKKNNVEILAAFSQTLISYGAGVSV